MPYYAASFSAIATIVDELKRYFATSPMRKGAAHDLSDSYDYTWSEHDSKIWISDQYPEKERKYPAIIMRTALNQPIELSLNQKASDEYDGTEQKTYTVGGGMYIQIALDVKAASTLDRARVADILVMGLLHPVRLAIAKRGLNLVPPFVTMTAESEKPLGVALSQFEYSASFTVKCFTTWEADYPLDFIPSTGEIKIANGQVEENDLGG